MVQPGFDNRGHLFAGSPVDDYQFVGVMPTAMLFQCVADPRRVERIAAGKDDGPLLRDISLERVDVQRSFEGAKKRNVGPYADYIVRVSAGQQAGVTPPIVLWTRQQLEVVEHGSGKALLLPYDVQFVAIDGETQTAARCEALKTYSRILNQPVPVIVHHGRDLEWARQAFHDLNALAVKPNAAVAISMDTRDPMTQIARYVEDHVTVFRGRVNHQRRQLGARDLDILTLSVLRTACVTFALGISGVQQSFRVNATDQLAHPLGHVMQTAAEWFDVVTEKLGDEFLPVRRRESILCGPAAMAAVGACGHPLLKLPATDVRHQAELAAEHLTEVNWSRGTHWDGIAGKLQPNGGFSTVGGAKENAYAIFRALSEPDSETYQQVRRQASVASRSRGEV